MGGFNVAAARQAGYTDDEILSHLTSTRNFDIQGALKAGYTKEDIIGHLAATSGPEETPGAQRRASIPGRVATGLGQGMVNALNPIPLLEAVATRPADVLRGAGPTPMNALLGGLAMGQRAREQIKGGQTPEAIGELVGGLGTQAALVGLPALGLTKGATAAKTGLSGYRAAKEVLATAPERRIAMQAEVSGMRQAGKAGLLGEKDAAQQIFNQRVADRIQPLFTQRKEALNLRTRTSASLAEQRTAVRENLRARIDEINRQAAEAKTLTTAEANQKAAQFAESVGKEMTRSEVAEGTVLARKRGWQSYTDKVSEIYNDIRDKTFANNVTEIVKTGPDGKPFTEPVAGAIDRSAVQRELTLFVERYREQLSIAKQNQSPGARAALEIVDGPAIVPGDVAIEDMAALNKLGYDRADAVIRTPAEATARRVAATYRNALKESIGKMQGGAEALGKLEEAKALLQRRDSIYRTGEGVVGEVPVARQVARSVQRYGEVDRLKNDPIGLRAYLGQVDDATRSGAKRQIAVEVAGKDYKDFSKNWTALDPQVKQLVFDPDQIMNGDRLAMDGPRALRAIADDAIAKNSTIIQESMRRLTDIGQKRAQLADITTQLREVQQKVTWERQGVREAKQAKSMDLQRKSMALRTEIDEFQRNQRLQFVDQMRKARETVATMRRLKIGVAVGATAIGAGALGWRAHNIATVLGW